jgi:hypothetical protein
VAQLSTLGVTRHRERDMKTSQKITLIVGLLVCAAAALFPPRAFRIDYSGKTPSPCFLFSSQFQIFWDGKVGQSAYVPVTSDAGRLLAELALIAAITGIVFILQIERKK